MKPPPDHDAAEEVTWAGRFITAKRRGRWEYVARARGIRAAVIVAIADGHILLVEQYRVPLGRASLELPAGLIGDEDACETDPLNAAARELEEETGWCAARLHDLGTYYSSPGMVSESFTLVGATGLTHIGPGGGVGDEHIVTHRVAVGNVDAFVASRRAAGVAIDVKLLLILGAGLLAQLSEH